MAGVNNELVQRSNAYYQDGALDTGRWAKIAELPDYRNAIAGFDWAGLIRAHTGKKRVAILDCGCGIGHFPELLLSEIPFPSDVVFDYDTVDTSPYSLSEHRRRLRHPFVARNSLNVAIEDFHPLPWAETYEIIWSMHSLYTVPRTALGAVVAALAELLAPDGTCLVYLPKKKSSYMVLFDLYLQEMDGGGTASYLTAEDVLAALNANGLGQVESVDCTFVHTIDASEPETLETYLNQICLRLDRLTLTEWHSNDAFRRYLHQAYDRQLSAWRFKQELSLISFSRGKTGRS